MLVSDVLIHKGIDVPGMDSIKVNGVGRNVPTDVVDNVQVGRHKVRLV